jgi:2-polyprenyl-6-methoxyphenol hydroxylase-like FAD-dependent oxidoreductase
MEKTDVVIAGGGLGGSLAAAMLGRAGIDAVMIDPHGVYPPDFRCEKLDGPQTAILMKTGIGEAVLAAGTPDEEAWVARMGRLVERRRGDQHGILYDTLVNTVRAQIPHGTRFLRSRVADIATSPGLQTVTLGSGETISCRLVVLANGLNNALRQSIGLGRNVISPCHSVTIGFNVRPLARAQFPFSSLTFYGVAPRTRIAYLTLFPVGDVMRANFMLYRDIHDPWLEAFRENPRAVMAEAMPGLEALTGDYEVFGHVKIRPADLYVTTASARSGLVLVGDAFATSCPAAGTGAGKALNDVERLCNEHIPHWLATPGMGAEKITAFYADPVKRAYDAHSIEKAYFLRSLSTEEGFGWQVRRWMRVAASHVRQARRQRGRFHAPAIETPDPAGAHGPASMLKTG